MNEPFWCWDTLRLWNETWRDYFDFDFLLYIGVIDQSVFKYWCMEFTRETQRPSSMMWKDQVSKSELLIKCE